MGLFGRDTKLDREAVFEQLKIDEGVVNEIIELAIQHLVLMVNCFLNEHGQAVGTPVSEDRVKECFEKDPDTAISECELLYEDGVFGDLPDEVQQIVVNMMFNMGRTRLSKFKKMHAAILKEDWKEASIEGRDSRWHKQVTNRAERLMVRLENV